LNEQTAGDRPGWVRAHRLDAISLRCTRRNDYMKPQRRKDIRIPIKIIDLRAFGKLCYTENHGGLTEVHEEYFLNTRIIERFEDFIWMNRKISGEIGFGLDELVLPDFSLLHSSK